MRATLGHRKDEQTSKVGAGSEGYRESIKNLIESEVKIMLMGEMRIASQELIEEQRNVIIRIVEEHRAAIRQVVDEEKQSIREQVEKMTRSLLQLALGGESLPPANHPTTAMPATSGSATMTIADLESMVRPAVVRVDVIGPGVRSSGSGVIIRGDGHIVTNEHIIDNAASITVTVSNGQQYPAFVTGGDKNLDLAIIRLTGSPPDLPVAVLGSTSDIIIGGAVVAGGFPLGSELSELASFTQAIVLAIRTVGGQRFIQTDVIPNPGSSGGALINRTNGKIIGITTAGAGRHNQDIEGIGLATPIDLVQNYIQANLE